MRKQYYAMWTCNGTSGVVFGRDKNQLKKDVIEIAKGNRYDGCEAKWEVLGDGRWPLMQGYIDRNGRNHNR